MKNKLLTAILSLSFLFFLINFSVSQTSLTEGLGNNNDFTQIDNDVPDTCLDVCGEPGTPEPNWNVFILPPSTAKARLGMSISSGFDLRTAKELFDASQIPEEALDVFKTTFIPPAPNGGGVITFPNGINRDDIGSHFGNNFTNGPGNNANLK